MVTDKKEMPKKKMSKSELEQALLDNFIILQKVMTNFAGKFDELSNNLSKLLQVFEISAKSFSEKYSNVEEIKDKKQDKELLKKLDSLLNQNKTIAQGIVMMEEKIKDRNKGILEPPKKSNLLPSRNVPRQMPPRMAPKNPGFPRKLPR